MKFPLGTSSSTVRSAPLLLIDGDRGRDHRTHLPVLLPPEHPRASTSCCGMRILVIKGILSLRPSTSGPSSPGASRSSGLRIVVRMALSGLDAALWDALAVAAGLPLATFLGAKPKPIPAYDWRADWASCRRRPPRTKPRLSLGGFLSVKLRLGHPRPGAGPRRSPARCASGFPTPSSCR